MRNSIVRIQRISINNIKNVCHGEIIFPSYSKEFIENPSEIIGLYGQNGSGKTALINSLAILKNVMSGQGLPTDTIQFINKNSNSADFSFEFSMNRDSQKFLVFYDFSLTKMSDTTIRVTQEKLSFKEIQKDQKTTKITFIDTTENSDVEIFAPATYLNELLKKDSENDSNLKVSKKMAAKSQESFIFRDDSRHIFKEGFVNPTFSLIVESMCFFARMNLFVIQNDHSGAIYMNLILPMAFRIESIENKTMTSGEFPIGFGLNTFSKQDYSVFLDIIEQMSKLVTTIIPGMNLETKSYGESIKEDGTTGYNVELMSNRNGVSVPIKYESDGIKKILSILSTMIAMYNSENVCVAIDELDAGVFEYLLGEMLKVLHDSGKGQLLFTSHNLRPLEVISKECLYFTTTNCVNRYIQFINIKNTNNLRDVYLRTIDLGGQKECS